MKKNTINNNHHTRRAINTKSKKAKNAIDFFSYELDEHLKQHIFQLLAYENQAYSFYSLSHCSKLFYNVSTTTQIQYCIVEFAPITSHPTPFFQFKQIALKLNSPITLRKYFQSASSTGCIELLQILIRHWFQENFDQNLLDASFLSAIQGGHLKTMDLLLKHNADIKFLDNRALYLGVHQNNSEIVQFLMENGSEINMDLLKTARLIGNSNIISILEDKYHQQKLNFLKNVFYSSEFL